MNTEEEISPMKSFRNYLQEESELDKLDKLMPPSPTNAGSKVASLRRPIPSLEKETKFIPDTLAKLVTGVFFHWSEMGNIGDLKRAIVVALALSGTDQKEKNVLNILEPISHDGVFPPKVFVPLMISGWFQDMIKTRRRLIDQLTDEELETTSEPSMLDLIWTISGGKGGTEWDDTLIKKKERN